MNWKMKKLLILLICLSIPATKCTISTDYLTPFPLQSKRLIAKSNRSFDDKGVVLVNYGEPLGIRYNPVSICQWAHKNYINYIRTPDKKYKKVFMNQVRWLVENQKNRDGIGVWEYSFANKRFNAKPPWISAMAQGLAISVLCEAFSLTKDKMYLDRAHLALQSFKKSVGEGGVVSYWPNGDIWYEEIASKDAKKTLNGFIFSLAGVADFYKLTGSDEAKEIVEKGLISLYNHIREYDVDFISRYSQLEFNVSWGYNRTHVLQLLWAYCVTRNSRFLEYAEKFASYDPLTYKVTASHSNIEARGPELMNDKYMFSRYWSSRKFPAALSIEFYELPEDAALVGPPEPMQMAEANKNMPLKSIIFFCPSERTCPKDYSIFLKDKKGKMNAEFSILENKCDSLEIQNSQFYRSYVRIHQLPELISSSHVDIIITTDNGNNNVAFREIVFTASRKEEVKKKLKIIMERTRGYRLFRIDY